MKVTERNVHELFSQYPIVCEAFDAWLENTKEIVQARIQSDPLEAVTAIMRLKTAVPSVKEFDEPLAALKANRDLSKLADLNKKISALEQRKAKGRKISESDLKSLTQAVDKFTESDNEATQTAAASLKDVDVTLMLFEPTGEFTESELGMVEALRKAGPAIAVINKVDLLNDFAALEARKKQVEEFGIFDAIVTVSAKDGTGCEELFPLLKQYANPGPHYFDDDAFTDMPEKELVAELVREKALLFMREEIPHGIAVTVESFKERPDSDLIDISVEICCERKSHKGMIIGKGGQMLKKIASAARMDCEELLGARVNLQCWVKVREDWRDNDRLLDNLGFAKP